MQSKEEEEEKEGKTEIEKSPVHKHWGTVFLWSATRRARGRRASTCEQERRGSPGPGRQTRAIAVVGDERQEGGAKGLVYGA